MLRSLPTRLRHRFRRPPVQPPADPVRFVCLDSKRLGIQGAVSASRARMEISRRRAWGHDVRAYPTSDRNGTPLTVVYVRVAYADAPGLEVLEHAFEFPQDIALPPDL